MDGEKVFNLIATHFRIITLPYLINEKEGINEEDGINEEGDWNFLSIT